MPGRAQSSACHTSLKVLITATSRWSCFWRELEGIVSIGQLYEVTEISIHTQGDVYDGMCQAKYARNMFEFLHV